MDEQQDSFPVEHRFFVVNKKGYCLWDTDIREVTLGYLNDINPQYFEYLATTYAEPPEDSAHAASIALRAAYSQGLETLFALIAAAVQAPWCVPAWIVKYRNSDLSEVIAGISKSRPLLSVFGKERLSWPEVSRILHMWLQMEDKGKETAIKDDFARLWSRFAHDFLDIEFNQEYNSIKHGLRVRPGGFSLALGVQTQQGIPAPRENMVLLGKSEFGSSYLVPEIVANQKHHLRLARHHRNWHPDDFVWGLHLISLSISNVVSALKILNGVPAEEADFQWITEREFFDEPWKRAKNIRLTSMRGLSVIIPDEFITPFSSEQILATYRINGGEENGVRDSEEQSGGMK